MPVLDVYPIHGRVLAHSERAHLIAYITTVTVIDNASKCVAVSVPEVNPYTAAMSLVVAIRHTVVASMAVSLFKSKAA